jgi:O-antigen biosynthesis protein
VFLIGGFVRRLIAAKRSFLFSLRRADVAVLAMLGRAQKSLLSRGHRFYRRHMKHNRFGEVIGRQLIKYKLVDLSKLDGINFIWDDSGTGDLLVDGEFHSDVPGFHLSPPLNFVLSDALATRPAINVLLPSLRRRHMSGGPNSALILAALLAERGQRVRLIACDAAAEGEELALRDHMDGLLRRSVARDLIELVDGFDRTKPVAIGLDDIFLATAWWTAQIAKYALAYTVHEAFVYLIQDFEPILHEAGTFYARALETYGFDHIPIINTELLFDHLVKEGAGRFADPRFAQKALWFEPALDRKSYFPERTAVGNTKKKVLLFYARPSIARRNLFELGVVALRKAVASGNIDKENWEVWAMGEDIPRIDLGNGVFLNPLPWMNFDDYAKRVRTADLMLSLMLSPHPSYPPLEMAASGRLVVTNSFSVKTPERMRALSPNILVAQPNAESIASTLGIAAGRINAGLPSNDPSGAMALPPDWDKSLSEIAGQLLIRIHDLRNKRAGANRPLAMGFPAAPKTDYEHYRRDALTRRRRDGLYQQEMGLLSFVTTVYNTAPVFLDELASSIFLQDGDMQFEWLILDNGSTAEETKKKLQDIARHGVVRLERVETNLGIIGGMRFCLEHASGRYILPLDSDDLVERDCVNVLTRFLQDNNYPAAVYTDEDKLDGESFCMPYFKPAWDPVLLLHSCYIAHLCAIDRKVGLKLELYSDRTAEGCHDWDSFIRLMNAGFEPRHVAEVLYSWRMHSHSTSANIGSKSYITQSHLATLQRALDHRDAPHLRLVTSPLFGYDVDWWYRRDRSCPISCETVLIEGGRAKVNGSVRAESNDGLRQLADQVAALSHELVHLQWHGIVPDSDEWLWDSAGLLEMFPDAVMVGGVLHDQTRITDGPRIFGFGAGYDCPDRGRLLSDPGYSAIIWKAHSVSAVSSGHCVVRRDFLLRMMPTLLAEKVPVRMIGPWLGALAAEQGMRILFSPFMAAKALEAPEDRTSKDARACFLSRFWPQFPDTRFYSPRLGLTFESGYTAVSDDTRKEHLKALQLQTLPYADWLARELRVRADRYPKPASAASISILTPVYNGSDLGLLDELARAIVSQTVPVSKWLLIVNGPMPEAEMATIRLRARSDWNAQVIVATEAIGIISALRIGLEAAESDYVAPVDADDLITSDAIQILVHEIDRNDRPDLLFSDEDILIDGKPSAPYLRAAYDPLLSLDNSTIWHLCAIKRDTAIRAGVYSDRAANWCQDWDSVSRIVGCGGRLEHVPEVLYHWRQHSGSTTNNAEGDIRSLDSVRHILERHIARCARPEQFEVAEWPESRGARELYIARRSKELPKLIWLGDALGESDDTCGDDAILVFASNGVSIDSPDVLVEVARLFEIHPGVGIVGGNVINRDNFIVDGCYMTNSAGVLESPWLGRSAADAGPFALALKTQSVVLPGAALAFFRVSALKRAGLWPPLTANSRAADMVWLLCKGLLADGWAVGFSPLVRARVVVTVRQECPARTPPVRRAGASHAFIRYGMSRNFVL